MMERNAVSYRRATTADVDTLVEMRIRFLNEMYDHADDEETALLRESVHGYFAATLANETFVAWLAERDGVTVGTSGMVLWQLPGRYDGLVEGRAGYILNFYTVPEERGRGICTRLLDELLNEGRRLGIRYFHLHATEDGISIYRRAGFTEPHLVEMELAV